MWNILIACINKLFLIKFQVLLEAAMTWERAEAAPVKRNDILAGTEFLSVFINGAMAPTPRRRGFRRGHSAQDNIVAESRQNEASIFRISKAPQGLRPTVTRPVHRHITAKLYPISHKSQSVEQNRQSFTPSIEELGSNDELGIRLSVAPTLSTKHNHQMIRINGTRSFISNKPAIKKVIGVSVTSSVEAAIPYRVRVENYNNDQLSVVTRPPIEPLSPQLFSTFSTSATTEPTTTTLKTSSSIHDLIISTTLSTTTMKSTSPTLAKLVTEELSNIVSESNRSEFSVDEGFPRTSTQARSTTRPIIQNSTPLSMFPKIELDSLQVGSNSEPVEQSYELNEHNPESHEIHQEPIESNEHLPQGRKAGRHYDTSLYNQPPKVYSQSSKVYGKPSRVYGESAKIYGEPAKFYSQPESIYGEAAKIYSEPSKIYGKPSEVYSEPSRVYSEPAKVYSQPSQIYGEPSKIYDSNGRPMEPIEQNYEVDEAVSVGSNGNAHGPQPTEIPGGASTDAEDNHKVGYVVEGRNYRKYRVEERTPDGFIVGEYGVVSHDDGSLRGVRYTADGTINPRLIYDALMKFLAL